MTCFNRQMMLAVSLGVFSTLAAAEEVVVIVNPGNSVANMTVDQVQQIYLGKNASLPSGESASAVDLAEGSPLRDSFYQKAAGRTRAQIKSVWTRLIFSGKSLPPRVVATSAEARKFVASNPNGIGYIEKSAVDSSVKVVLSMP